MPVDSFFSQILSRMRGSAIGLRRSHIAVFALTLIVFGIALGGLEAAPGPPAPAYGTVLDLELPSRGAASDRTEPAPTTAAPVPAPAQEAWDRVVVKPGQSLDAIFRAQGFSAAVLQEILALNDETRSLKKIRPGDEFAFQRGADGSLERMRYTIDEARYLVIDNHASAPAAWVQPRVITSELVEAQGTIESSLFLAGKAAGLSDAMVMKLANIFGWDIDFVLDIRSGDRFVMLYEKLYRDGEYLRDGDVLAATFVNQGDRYQAIRFEADNGPQYYAPDGRHMRKAFLRAPLNFSYISSNFNPRRFHPILKRIKAHNGIDYRAPTGTPVYAAGDGRVTDSAYSQYNGNYVFIQHANSIVTKYLHFSKRAVKRGERVRQGQVIGYVGATGLAQAPHLHYEFVVNGAHRNPRTVSLPAVEPLKDEHLATFRQHAAPYLAQLVRLESASMYASSE
jgi:murein DD-endopeptidase MepM/ murein hydrolase activator NlpD